MNHLPPDDATTLRLDAEEMKIRAEEARTIPVAAPVSKAAPGEQSGDKIGRYKLLKELGEGGFGTVWLAEQSEPIQREVALKVIKPGMDSREIIARFAAERQTLALMEHPNIAAVLDAGATEGGRPFFVMELVKGEPVTSYCDKRRLTLRQRLELFIPVCQAVQHAHQKAVLHRDLKPSNILVMEVDGKAVPKVIDFGIAKALGGMEDVPDANLVRTQAGMVIGTPQYMSPEQAGSRSDVDTRSDIYTLGIILYELLTGKTPLSQQEIRQAALDEMLRLIRECETKKPSSSLLPASEAVTSCATARGSDLRKLTAAMRGDLDWIVLKALEKERERRYETATALADDIRRYLQSEPVSAAAPGVMYRFKRLVRRNRLVFSAATAVFGTLIAGVTVSTWQWRETLQEREQKNEQFLRAKASREQAEKIMIFLLGDLRTKLSTRAALSVLVEVEKQVEDYYDKLGVDGQDEAQLNTRAWAYLNQGLTQEALGNLSLAVSCQQKALAIRRQLVAARPEEKTWQRELATNISKMAHLYELQGAHDPAAALYQESADIRRRLAAGSPADSLAQYDLSVSLNNLGRLDKVRNRLPEALKFFQEDLAIMEGIIVREPDNPRWEESLSTTVNQLGYVRMRQGDFESAAKDFVRSFQLRQKLVANDPDNLPLQRELAVSHENIGDVYRAGGALAEALERFKQSRAIKEKLVADDPQNAGWQADLVRCLESISDIQQRQRNTDAAIETLQQAVGIEERLVAKDSANLSWQFSLSVNYNNLGILHSERKNLPAALRNYQRHNEIMQQLIPLDPKRPDWRRELAVSYSNLGSIQREMGDRQGAEVSCSIALETAEALQAAGQWPTDKAGELKLLRENLAILRVEIQKNGR